MDNTDTNCGVQKTVTSVGNAWILSRSKSYSGRVYYFNTLTGEAVWNLSNEEIEKAKKRTAKLPLQSENFPEPQEPPCDPSNHDSYQDNTQQTQMSQYITPKEFNNQIISNKLTRSQFPLYLPPCHNCTPLNSIPNMAGIRPNMWIHPPPIFLTTPGTSLTNINQTAENVSHHSCFSHNFIVQNTSMPLSKRFSFGNTKPRGKNLSFQPHGVGKFSPRFNKFNGRKPFVPKIMPNNNGVSDLRTIITGKKIMNETLTESQENHHTTVQETVNSNKTSKELVTPAVKLENKVIKDDLIVNMDDEWLKNNGTIDGAKLKVDVTILKNLATENSECECWYIVVDKNVLMRHFNFLNVLTTSDPQCKLMVVRGVLSELQASARAGPARDVARAVRHGLSRLFAAKLAVIAEYSFKSSEINDCTGMINFYLMLRQQKEHVVLLSNEEALQKHSSNLPILTIQDVKELLTSGKKDVKIICPIIERNIKITIPNDLQSSELSTPDDDKKTEALQTTTETQCKKICNTETRTRETNIQTECVFPAVLKMVDAEVQTDPLEVTQPATQKDSVGVNTVENITEIRHVESETNVDKYVGPEDSTVMLDEKSNPMVSQENNKSITQEDNTWEIRLKRSLSNVTTRSSSNDANKKHFKWHRKKRDGSVGFSDSNSSLDDRISSRMSSTKFEINAYAPQISNIYDAMYQRGSQSTQMSYSDFGEGSENSSGVFIHKEATENIVIEETSTSATDVISNSVSNVGSEIREINKCKENTNTNYETQNKNVMFEISSKEMEQNLKMRRDELLAEFSQIMEEVLTQILRRKSEDIVKAMPPPWTLHEATECIKRTFISDCDVFDAASRLSQILHTMSDMKGKIKINFNPKEFMELYSYGVYLVDSLQSILDKCEDLQVASESLAKLLKHIESPIAEGPNDMFSDVTDVSADVSQTCSEAAANQEHSSNVSSKSNTPRRTRKSLVRNSNLSPGKYNLRSSRKTKPNEENDINPAVKFIRKINISDDFFSSLHLLRTKKTTEDTLKLVVEAPVELTDKKVEDKPPEKPADKGPNIIRNFSRCPKFEEKLKNQYRGESLDMDKLDYSMGYNDYEYDNMEEAYLDEFNEYTVEGGEECLENDTADRAEEPATDANNNNFKMLVSSLMDEIKETTANVYSFCQTTHDEIQSENMHSGRRIEIHDKAQKANAHIQNICDSFRRIQEENMNQNGHGVRSRLKEAGVPLNDREIAVYRKVIGSCIEQGQTLLESINTIIDTLKT